MNLKLIIGWAVLAAGLLVIAQAIGLSYGYFTAKQDFPAVFKPLAAGQNAALQSAPALSDPQAQMQQAMSQATNQALANMLPADAVTKLLNGIVWSVFATFLVYAGAHIAGIGIKMIG